jgi:hypothetical protein
MRVSTISVPLLLIFYKLPSSFIFYDFYFIFVSSAIFHAEWSICSHTSDFILWIPPQLFSRAIRPKFKFIVARRQSLYVLPPHLYALDPQILNIYFSCHLPPSLGTKNPSSSSYKVKVTLFYKGVSSA